MEKTDDIMALWMTGVRAVRGDVAVSRAIADGIVPKPDRIIAVGKAAVAMARPACDTWPDVPCLIVTKYDHAEGAPPHATVMEAAHPVPDEASITAGRALQEAVAACDSSSRLLMLVSGGASALAEVPQDGLSLQDLMDSTSALLASGATIAAMNMHRSARSQIKGGKLLAGFKGAQVTTLAISDVEGDALATIGSGIGDAPADREFDFQPYIVASNTIARDAVAAASALPITMKAETLYGDITSLVPVLRAQLHAAPAGLIVLGGEPVVLLPPAPGKGGRNMALALNLAREIAGIEGLRILVGGTDGTDGPTDAAGALVDGSTWDDSGADALERADAYPWLEARGALVKTGPTGTNVADLLVAIKD
ncbi:DUF4147 domain-containing protein [Tateyamaria armeniaca]|uniref:DUF4147 domain-containing protein n=1 Tax=Tateyamaria armeniaca TaxID=2518930 RepID=A0ABW8UY26_9RHOB